MVISISYIPTYEVYWIIREFITVTITNPNCTQVFSAPWSKYGPFHGKSWKTWPWLSIDTEIWPYGLISMNSVEKKTAMDGHRQCRGYMFSAGFIPAMVPWFFLRDKEIGQLWLRKTTQLVLSEGDDKNQLLVQSMIDLWALQKLIKTSQNPGTRTPKLAQWVIILPKYDKCSSISIWAVL